MTDSAFELVCSECGAGADEDADGWRMLRADLPDEDNEPQLGVFCPECASATHSPGPEQTFMPECATAGAT